MIERIYDFVVEGSLFICTLPRAIMHLPFVMAEKRIFTKFQRVLT